MAIYVQTTQFKFWTFSEMEADSLKLRLDKVQGKRDSTESSLLGLIPKLVTSAEITQYHQFWQAQIDKMAVRLRLSSRIASIAVMFYKRFYLIQSLAKYDPKHISYMCVFLAMKSENVHMGLQEFTQKIKGVEAGDLRPLELVLLSTLRFHLAIVLPHESVLGFILDFQHFRSSNNRGSQVISEPSFDDSVLVKKAYEYVLKAMQTDLVFVTSPAQIALACFEMAVEKIISKSQSLGHDSTTTSSTMLSEWSLPVLHDYLEKCILSKVPDPHVDAFKTLIKDIKAIISRNYVPDTSLIKDIDARITKSRSQLKDQ